jgi:RNA-directed DNA polymerase
MLALRVKDAEAMWLLKEIVSSFSTGQRDLFHPRGVPIGNLTSQLFANVYMNEFDQFVKHELKAKHYVRYTDDFIIVSADKAELQKLLTPIERFLQETLLLSLHPNKIQLVKYHNGVDFLGYVEFTHHRLMRETSKRRMMRKISHAAFLYRHGAIEETRMNATLQSYFGTLKHADAYRLSETLKNRYWIRT